MLANGDAKFWAPVPEVLAWVSSLVDQGAKVLEIGPGTVPFSRAGHFVDWKPGANITRCDLNREILPFSDKQFDFIYCRHVVEDLYNPFLVCGEMSRVGKAGYIETPSPLAEFCRGIDGGSPKWRGYQHHRYFVWNDNGVLSFVDKYPIVEYIEFGEEIAFENALRGDPLLWNTYFLWQGSVKWTHLQHEVDFQIYEGYPSVLAKAMNLGIENARSFRDVMYRALASRAIST